MNNVYFLETFSPTYISVQSTCEKLYKQTLLFMFKKLLRVLLYYFMCTGINLLRQSIKIHIITKIYFEVILAHQEGLEKNKLCQTSPSTSTNNAKKKREVYLKRKPSKLRIAAERYVSLQLRVQNRRRKWHFPPNFRNGII